MIWFGFLANSDWERERESMWVVGFAQTWRGTLRNASLWLWMTIVLRMRNHKLLLLLLVAWIRNYNSKSYLLCFQNLAARLHLGPVALQYHMYVFLCHVPPCVNILLMILCLSFGYFSQKMPHSPNLFAKIRKQDQSIY